MLLGHYAVALAAKRYAPRTSLGTLVLAAQLLDLLWPIFVLLGWERVDIVPGLMAASPFDFVYYPISHSLLTAAIWGVLLGGGYYVFRRNRRGAIVIALAVLSHWLLDVPMHRPDLPLWPGSATKVGFGLWDSVAATVAIEILLLAIGILMYVRATRPRDRTGTLALVAMVVLLTIIFVSGFFAPPPASARWVALAGIGLWLFVPWAYWIDGHREASRVHGGG
ncbi:MAG: metal-dependent hydrolase [Burkholderiales bacterium]